MRDKLNEEVDFLKAAQKAMVEEKEKEGNELKASIEESNAESRDNIEQIRRETQNNIKVAEISSSLSIYSHNPEVGVGEQSEADRDEGEDTSAGGREEGELNMCFLGLVRNFKYQI